jgi:regulator of sirC expression with transglutaminase-like and TPR domain
VIFYGRVRELLELLSGRSDDVQLDRAALELATIEYPGLDIENSIAILDSYAVELRSRIATNSDGADFVIAANTYLFNELGFTGNTNNYYDPRNSCLNEVLAGRLGIPITLSLVYMEIARRLERPVYGIGLPGHFLVRYDDGEFAAFIDPFRGGKLLDEEECFELARSSTGAQVPEDSWLLQPVGKRQILLRMMNNLRGIYFSRAAHSKALQVLNLLIVAEPDAAEEHRQRGAIHLRLKNYSAAREDLERYLALAGAADERANVEKQLRSLKHFLAGLN